MDNIVKIERSVTRALAAQPTAEKVALELVPQLRQAIELCETPDEANKLRSLIGMAQTFLKQNLPKELKKRSQQFRRAFPANWGYVEASAKAGILWEATDNKHPSGVRYDRSENSPTLSVTDAGFKGSRDATACNRAAELLLPEEHPEIEIYKKDGRPLPPPTNKRYSGKFVLRVGSELHQALAIKAMNNGDSLNSYVVKALRKEFSD